MTHGIHKQHVINAVKTKPPVALQIQVIIHWRSVYPFILVCFFYDTEKLKNFAESDSDYMHIFPPRNKNTEMGSIDAADASNRTKIDDHRDKLSIDGIPKIRDIVSGTLENNRHHPYGKRKKVPMTPPLGDANARMKKLERFSLLYEKTFYPLWSLRFSHCSY